MPAVHPKNREALEQRVARAAEAALARRQYVSPIDVLSGMGVLEPVHLEAWRKGRIDFLERVIQGNLSKITAAMAAFHRWAGEKGLRPSETAYTLTTRHGTEDLRFSRSGDPAIEKNYRTHYVSPALSERKQERIVERSNREAQPVVFQILRESQCSECGVELDRGSLLSMEAGRPLCLPCVHLGGLEYLPAGDAAQTRRAAKYSARTAVVSSAARGAVTSGKVSWLKPRPWRRRSGNACSMPVRGPSSVRAEPRPASNRIANSVSA